MSVKSLVARNENALGFLSYTNLKETDKEFLRGDLWEFTIVNPPKVVYYPGDDIFKKPAFDLKMEGLIPVIKKEIPLKAHAHTIDDMFTTLAGYGIVGYLKDGKVYIKGDEQ